MKIVDIADHTKIDEGTLTRSWLENERDIAYDAIKGAQTQFELDKANSAMKYIIWRIECIEFVEYD